MFQYSHEMIINSLGDDKIVSTKTGVVTIKRVGEYSLDKIGPLGATEHKIFKTEPVDPVMAKITMDFADAIKVNTTAGESYPEIGTYNLQLFVKLADPWAIGEYASPNWYRFGKPLMVGLEVTDEMAEDKEKLAAKVHECLKLAIPADNQFVKLQAIDGTKVTLVATIEGMYFLAPIWEKYDQTVCDSCLGEYVDRTSLLDVEITDKVDAFGTSDWMTRNYHFPSYPNIRFASANEDMAIVKGARYVQYAFDYSSPRPGFGGLSGVGQVVAATTKHILYVREDLATEFETKLAAALGATDLFITAPTANNVSASTTPTTEP